jgi:hypothetical protein
VAPSNLITNLTNVEGVVMVLRATKKGSCLWCRWIKQQLSVGLQFQLETALPRLEV